MMNIVFTYAFRNLCNRFKSFVVICVCATVSFFMLDMSMTSYNFARFELVDTKRVVKCDPKRVYKLSVTSFNIHDEEQAKRREAFYKEVKALGQVEDIGWYDYGKRITKDGITVKTLVMPEGLLAITTGKPMTAGAKEENYCYVGEGVKDLISGTELVFKKSKGKTDTHKIVGSIPSDTRWFTSSLGFALPIDYSKSIDDYVVINEVEYEVDEEWRYTYYNDFEMYVNMLVLMKEGSSVKDAKEIEQLAVKYDLVIDFKNFSEMYDEYMKNNRDELMTYGGRVLVMILLVTISISSACTVSILLQKKQYGIMFCNGVRRIQVYLICIIENALTVVISAAVAYMLCNMTYTANMPTQFEKDTYAYIHNSLNMPILIGIYVAITFVASIIPLYILKNYRVTDMMKGGD